MVALFTGGAFFGAMFASPTTSYLGRRLTIMIGALVFLLGGGLQTGARDISYLMAGRFFAGLGVGFLTMIIPLYQAEIAHPSIRGKLCSTKLGAPHSGQRPRLIFFNRSHNSFAAIYAWTGSFRCLLGWMGLL